MTTSLEVEVIEGGTSTPTVVGSELTTFFFPELGGGLFRVSSTALFLDEEVGGDWGPLFFLFNLAPRPAFRRARSICCFFMASWTSRRPFRGWTDLEFIQRGTPPPWIASRKFLRMERYA